MTLLAATVDGQAIPTPTGGGRNLRRTLLPVGLTPYAHVTITPANTVAALAELDAAVTAATARPVRERLIDVSVEPGDYVNYPGPYPMVYIHGTTGDPADVRFIQRNTSGGTWHWWGGRQTWLDAVTLRTETNPDGTSIGAKYPLHVTGGGGDLVFTRCRFEAFNTRSDGGASVLGMDGGSKSTITFYACHFESYATGPAGFNMHGPDSPDGRTLNFIDCTAPTGTQIGYSSLSDKSRVYVVGGTVTLGAMTDGAVGYTTDWTVQLDGIAPARRMQMGLD